MGNVYFGCSMPPQRWPSTSSTPIQSKGQVQTGPSQWQGMSEIVVQHMRITRQAFEHDISSSAISIDIVATEVPLAEITSEMSTLGEKSAIVMRRQTVESEQSSSRRPPRY